ncbi:uncharacterized protein [Aegilops tauschii subsp. strangulata]|uniref:uncharacterized protein n=1 Tax=Aegilops tauschii subsp. strangulata TaxID=200361 RepID=UPI00098BA88C|nr:uncharacterized protein LOC109759989 [Aegilops tauschii subsp. strangulata]
MESDSVNRDDPSEEARVLPLALFAMEHNSKKRLLFDVSSGNICGITSALFPDAFVEFESCGWLLMVRHKPFHFQEQVVFLVHPSTGRRIDMPVLRSPDKCYFVFYADPRRGSGAPLVVACVQIMSVVPTVHVACPGDVYWCVHKHTCQLHLSEAMCKSFHNTLIMDVALVGTQAVCAEFLGQILIFDITEMAWRAASCPEWSIQDAHYLVASIGKVVIVSCPRASAFKFLQLDMEALAWSPLDDQELEDTSWFLSQGQSIRVKEEGRRKVYTFHPRGRGNLATESSDGWTITSGPATLKTITNIYAYDLVAGTVETVIPASIVTEVSCWVRPSTFATSK